MRGPRKKRRRGGPAPRFSTHKTRARWFQSRAAWPFREADGDHLVAERARTAATVARGPVPATHLWELMGPTNVGGRCTAIVCHPVQTDTVWIGAAGGGVWKSTDGGTTWTSLWHSQDSLNVGSLAIDARNPDVIYCGTGEANLSADSYPGVGIYRSTDAGLTWALWAASKGTGLPRRIGVIAIDPFDSRHVLVGGVTHTADELAGLFVTTDAGATWKRQDFVSAGGYFTHAVAFHPKKQGVIFAGVYERGSKSGIWRTTDGGSTWTQLAGGLPSPDQFRRTSLAIAPSAPDTIYAQVGNDQEGVLGVFVSTDMGETWNDISGNAFADEGQMSYGNTIVVHPTDPKTVLCGGVDLHRTNDGGATWVRTSKWDSDRGKPDYAHADHHCLLMPAARPGLVYDPNDGGMDRSEDAGQTWSNRSNGLAATMFYDLDVALSDPKSFGGGAQDNGTNVTTTGSADDHFEILGGDGGWMVYNPQQANRLYASYYNFHIFRFRGSQQPANISPPAPAAERNAIWMCYITLDPNTPTTAFTGSTRVWRTKNDGSLWKAVSRSLDDSPISAIEVAPADSKAVYVGTENGSFFRSTDGGDTWSGNLAGALVSGRMITRIETHPTRADTLFVTTAGTGGSHVFTSADGGTTWTDIDQGRLPDVPHNALVVPPDDVGSLYVANDVGVFVTADGGATWTNLTRNMPNVMVVDLVYHQGQGTLWAATYGRSIWRLALR
jgi:photosystem II stability/assembly factor-like uncharacterized protein